VTKLIHLVTTTSIEDSGLLDVLIPLFREQTGIAVKVVAVSNDQALELRRRGDADVLLVNLPSPEMFMVSDGGITYRPYLERALVLVSDFVLVGPPDDPGHVRGRASITVAFQEIARRQVLFVSCADDAATHQKEQQVWDACHVQPGGDWYLTASTGIAEALRLANEKRAYILTDRASYVALRDKLDLTVVSEGDPLLKNPYHALVMNPAMTRNSPINFKDAQKFIEFLTCPDTQRVISRFGLDRYGQALFIPSEAGH
jgi:tungstate transport system substrate-binding protein